MPTPASGSGWWQMAPEIELPEGVWDTAMAAKEAVRYVDHPDNYQAVYGMSRYAVRALIAAAFKAGRESMYDRVEYRLVAPGDPPHIKSLSFDTVDAFRELGYLYLQAQR